MTINYSISNGFLHSYTMDKTKILPLQFILKMPFQFFTTFSQL